MRYKIISLLVLILLAGCESVPVLDPYTVTPGPDIIAQTEPTESTNVRYDGRPPSGIFEDQAQQNKVYHFSRIEITEWGPTIVYDSDIGKMVLTFEKDGNTWDAETEVSYAFCLDFINENLGKTSNFGFLLQSVKCTQKGLGKEY